MINDSLIGRLAVTCHRIRTSQKTGMNHYRPVFYEIGTVCLIIYCKKYTEFNLSVLMPDQQIVNIAPDEINLCEP